ncbi:putative secreted protein (Por secretion system target) [Flavobacterium araucananum]|uniref:Secretion system C-terminal sorting domain-containing protein n=1 Tax=Flavobacterium araucananum TaxID=946678 RepID=A0A227P4U7_9FLAO|nr:T9SS type A sorting domain-containing protein [Flavobacterium araucananum]OXG04929.1 hypothetical protein B0A64_13900 [Flavobacterium araucananum]PWK02018.1 putative secreted protein (Por secretion system target) [Flavobacterium araucananum]
MKKITLLVFSFLTIIGWSQSSNYRYHELQDLGSTIESAIAIECIQHYSPVGVREVNLKQNFKLEVGKIYKADLGLTYGNFGTRYYKVTYAHDSGVDMGDVVDTPPNFGAPITDLCNSLSRKFIRPILLGSTLQEAQNNFCSSLTVNSTRETVNIKIAKSLSSGDVCYMDFGKGANYYLIDGADVESGDADYEVDSTDNNSLFSLVAFNCQKPDLQAVSVDPETINDNYYRGSGIGKRAYYYIRNIGTNIENTNTLLTLYLTTSRNFITANDIKLASSGLEREYVNSGVISALSFSIPYNASIGKYYLTLKITNREDINTYNNIVSSVSRITIKDGTPPTTPIPTPTPTPAPIGKPDLIIDPNNTLAYSDDCFDCNPTLSENKKRHRINNQSGSLRFPIVSIKNIGTAMSSTTNLRFYVSSDATLDTSDIKYNGNPVSINAIKPEELFVLQGVTIFSTNFGNIGSTLNGNWNILMVVDDAKTNTELNENNNITAIPVTFYNPFAKTAQDKLESQESYSINIYNFDGQKVLTKEVKTKEEENKSLDSLKSGIYIIKSKDETRKVIK